MQQRYGPDGKVRYLSQEGSEIHRPCRGSAIDADRQLACLEHLEAPTEPESNIRLTLKENQLQITSTPPPRPSFLQWVLLC